jgi:environmental stress-induced protein Ves
MKLVRCDRVEPQAWRNGGGLTRELLAWPSRDHWALRISVADIRADGPFSAYPGVDRWFAVLEGGGVMLALPEGKRCLGAADAPLHFRGEAAPDCELLDDATRDLNLMIRRGTGRGAMQRAQAGEDFAAHARFRALFTADALTLQVDGTDALQVPPFALAWADGGAHGVWRIAADAPVRAWWIDFEPNA